MSTSTSTTQSKAPIRLPWLIRPERHRTADISAGDHAKICNASILRAVSNPNSTPNEVISLFTAAARRRGFRPELSTCTSLLSFLLRHRRLLAAELLLRRLRSGPSLLIPLASSSIAAGISSRSAAQLLLCSSPSASAFTSLLGSIIRSGHLNLASSVLRLTVVNGVGFPLRIRHFAGIIREYCRRGSVDEAEELLALMGEGGVTADIEIWNSFLAAVCARRGVDDGVRVYLAMANAPDLPNAITFSTLIRRMGMEGRVLGCDALFGRMVVVGVSLDLAFYRILIGAYCRSGLFRDAVAVLRAMKIDGFFDGEEFEEERMLECGLGFEEVALCLVLKKGIIGGFLP